MMKQSDYRVARIEAEDHFSSHFFMRRRFLEYQSAVFGKDVVSVGVFSNTDNTLLAYQPWAGKDGHWASPITGAFGGVAVKKGTAVQALEALIDHTPEVLAQQRSVASMTVRLPPGCFSGEAAMMANIMLRKGWTLQDFDINYHLALYSAERYLTELGETKRKFIRRLQHSGAEFLEIECSMLKAVYHVIEQNRQAQGYPMTMSLDAMIALADHFPEDIRCFAVIRNHQMLAAAICIRVSTDYLYVFYWGELPECRKESPVLLLAKGIVEYCIQHHIDIMDIGTSSVNSVPNPGLCAFKASLGCKTSPKLTFSCTMQG